MVLMSCSLTKLLAWNVLQFLFSFTFLPPPPVAFTDIHNLLKYYEGLQCTGVKVKEPFKPYPIILMWGGCKNMTLRLPPLPKSRLPVSTTSVVWLWFFNYRSAASMLPLKSQSRHTQPAISAIYSITFVNLLVLETIKHWASGSLIFIS